MKKQLDQVATADLTTVKTVQQMAEAEGWTADDYTLELSERIRTTSEPLDSQRERLAALANLGALGDQAAAAELSRHSTLLTSLLHRFIWTAAEMSASEPLKTKPVETYANAALKTHHAILLTLSAIKTIRDSQREAPQ